MNHALPLVADAGDVIGLVIGVIFVLIAVVGQIMAKFREMRQPGRRPPARPPQPGAKPKPLEDEIRQFLRGAAQRRGQPQAARPQQVGPPRAPGQPRPARPMPARIPPAPPAEAVVEAEVVAAPQSLRERLESRKPRSLGHALGTDVAAADDGMATHLHAVFDHRLGSLERAPGDTARLPSMAEPGSPEDGGMSLPSTAAAGLAAMFATAENLRTAVLINEILQRPEHRWE